MDCEIMINTFTETKLPISHAWMDTIGLTDDQEYACKACDVINNDMKIYCEIVPIGAMYGIKVNSFYLHKLIRWTFQGIIPVYSHYDPHDIRNIGTPYTLRMQ